MIKKYFVFINESIITNKSTVEFVMSNRLVDIFKKISTRKDDVGYLAKQILELNFTNCPSSITLLDIEDSNLIRFVKSEKAKELFEKEFGDFFIDSSEFEDLFHKLNKSDSIRIGRLVVKLIELYEFKFNRNVDFTEKTIELFVNEFKSLVDIKKGKLENIKIVSKHEILKYYLHDSYSSKNGTLGSSCMRYVESQDYLHLYVNNPDSVSLVIYLDDSGKILGRALLWNLLDGNKFMDRIYTNSDYDVNLFIKWAKENKFLYKEDQDSYSGTLIFSPKNDYKEALRTILEVSIKPIPRSYSKYYKFPFLDTLKFFYWENGLLSNRPTPYNYFVTLEDVNGEFLCDACEGSGVERCSSCKGSKVDCLDCNETGYIDCDECGNFKDNKKTIKKL